MQMVLVEGDHPPLLIYPEFITTLLSAPGRIKFIHQASGSGKSTCLNQISDCQTGVRDPRPNTHSGKERYRAIRLSFANFTGATEEHDWFLRHQLKEAINRLTEQGLLAQPDQWYLHRHIDNLHNDYHAIWNELIAKLNQEHGDESQLLVLIDSYDYSQGQEIKHHKHIVRNELARRFLAPVFAHPRVDQVILFGHANHSATIVGAEHEVATYDCLHDTRLQPFFSTQSFWNHEYLASFYFRQLDRHSQAVIVDQLTPDVIEARSSLSLTLPIQLSTPTEPYTQGDFWLNLVYLGLLRVEKRDSCGNYDLTPANHYAVETLQTETKRWKRWLCASKGHPMFFVGVQPGSAKPDKAAPLPPTVITINKLYSKVVKPITLSVDIQNTTLADLAHLYLSELNKQTYHIIEKTQYNLFNDEIQPTDMTFYLGGHQYSCRVPGIKDRRLADVIDKATRTKKGYTLHANISLYGERNYCLNGHLKLFSRTDPTGHQLTDLQVAQLRQHIGFDQ